MACPLPQDDYLLGVQRDAYQKALGYEAGSDTTDDIMFDRYLGRMLHEIPTEAGRWAIAKEVKDCDYPVEPQDLAEIYISRFTKCCKYEILQPDLGKVLTHFTVKLR